MRTRTKTVTAGLTGLAMTGLLVGTSVLTAAPAAAETCSDWQKREFPTSGFNTDVRIQLCVEDTGLHGAFARVEWGDGGGVRKFDNFDVHVRVERYDVDYDKGSCDFTTEINANSSGDMWCYPASTPSEKNGGWTADGYVAFDLDADGNGGASWSLRGSPAIG